MPPILNSFDLPPEEIITVWHLTFLDHLAKHLITYSSSI